MLHNPTSDNYYYFLPKEKIQCVVVVFVAVASPLATATDPQIRHSKNWLGAKDNTGTAGTVKLHTTLARIYKLA